MAFPSATQPSPSSSSSSSPSLDDYDPNAHVSVSISASTSTSASVLQADVVFTPDVVVNNNNNNDNNNKEEQEHQKQNRNWDRSLFITLYVMLLLATAGLAFSVARYVQAKKANRPALSSSTTRSGDDTTSPATLLAGVGLDDIDPDRDPVAYRSDIEYILTAEIGKGTSDSLDFLEGAPKKAIDWLVYEDLVLTSSNVREMAESIDMAIETVVPVSVSVSVPHVPTFPLVQRYVMMVLFFGTNGELWSGSPWTDLVDVHECNFAGVECDLEKQAIILDLAFRKLRGRLPEEVGMLTKLTSANFLSNNLEGSIPSFIFNKLTNLEFLDLSINEFTSTISSDISKLTNIKTLQLSELSLTGRFPDTMKSLTTLEQITCTHASQMSGPLLEFSKYWPDLKYVDLFQSDFTGTIPTSIGMNTKLEFLWLEDVSMNFTNIPTELGLLTNLEIFVMDHRGGDDGGTIPTELGNCQAMEYMQISASHFVGTIPTELGLLTNLSDLRIFGGMITGYVPSELGLLTNLDILMIARNRLEGTLPSELGNIQNLTTFGLWYNDLTGSIPSGVCESTGVEIYYDCTMEECECCYLPCKK